MEPVVDRIMKYLGDFAHYVRSDNPDEIEARRAVVSLVLDAMNEAGLIVSGKAHLSSEFNRKDEQIEKLQAKVDRLLELCRPILEELNKEVIT